MNKTTLVVLQTLLKEFRDSIKPGGNKFDVVSDALSYVEFEIKDT